MIVSVDIQAAIAQRAGVGRYTKSLVENLAPLAGEDELQLFYFDFKRKGNPFPVEGATENVVHWCPGRLAQGAWKRMGWPPYDWFAGRADLYHFPNFIRPPVGSGKSIVTIHDVAFLRLPETIEERNLAYLDRKIHETVSRSDAIIAVSEFTAREIRNLLNVPAERVIAIYEGLSASIARPPDEAIRATRNALGLERPYLLMVSTLEPRKNIPFLVDVYEALGDFDGDLVLAGMKGWKYEPIMKWIQNSPRAGQIIQIDYVPENQLPALYAGAELFVFPSLYEGFGFPPLEAMACGTPVVSSTAGALPEVLGDAALLIEGYDEQQWADVIHGLLRDETRKRELRNRGRDRVQRYTWKKTAQDTWKVYRQVGGAAGA